MIRVIDFETTGLPSPGDPHAVVEVGWCDLDDGAVLGRASLLCDPGRPVDITARAIHHIADEQLVGKRRFAPGDYATPDVDVLAAHKAEFERHFFGPTSQPWICTFKCALRLWPDAPAHGNQVLRYWLGIDSDAGFYAPDAMPPHRAGADAYVTAHILRRMLETETVETLIAWTTEPTLLVKVGFGKHAGRRWDEVPREYLEWIVGQDFKNPDVLATARHYLGAMRPAPAVALRESSGPNGSDAEREEGL